MFVKGYVSANKAITEAEAAKKQRTIHLQTFLTDAYCSFKDIRRYLADKDRLIMLLINKNIQG